MRERGTWPGRSGPQPPEGFLRGSILAALPDVPTRGRELQTRRRAPRRVIVTALVASAVAGCVITRDADSRLDTATVDSSVSLGTRADSTSGVSRAREVDTASSTGEVADSAQPSRDDLRILSAEMIIPLDGVKPEELRDTFNELRGGGTRTHQALDIMAARGTPVHSAAPGRVLKLFTSKAGGLMVYAADSTERFVLMYAHLDGYAAEMRDGLPLRRGQVIGYVGTTGNAPPEAPHLHFAIARTSDVDIWWTGTPVDPRPLLQHRIGME